MGAAVAVAAVVGLTARQRPTAEPSRPVATRSVAAAAPLEPDEPPSGSPAAPLQGRVREVIEVPQYTYLRLETKQGEVWAAVSKAPIVVDSNVIVENPTRMEHFESATLKRTFEVIYFGNLPTSNAVGSRELPPGHPRIDSESRAPDIVVARASGSNAHTIGELFNQSAKLEGKLVRVRGQVSKVTAGVQGKTYLRLRDGSSARPEERELVATSQVEAQIGTVATFEGTLRTQVDVGIGFRYPILLTDARVIANDPDRDQASASKR
jgi:hypothetical protein